MNIAMEIIRQAFAANHRVAILDELAEDWIDLTGFDAAWGEVTATETAYVAIQTTDAREVMFVVNEPHVSAHETVADMACGGWIEATWDKLIEVADQ
jgi:hypothetical protein